MILLKKKSVCAYLCVGRGWLSFMKKYGICNHVVCLYFNHFSPNNGWFQTNLIKYQNLKDATFRHEKDQHDMQWRTCRWGECHFFHVSGKELRQSLWVPDQLANQHYCLLPGKFRKCIPITLSQHKVCISTKILPGYCVNTTSSKSSFPRLVDFSFSICETSKFPVKDCSVV